MVFIAGIGLIFMVFPGESRFKYEFQKGKPWIHEDLVSPFDFPIYKTEAELFEERNLILKDFKPFFTNDSTAKNTAIIQFKNDFVICY